MEYWFNYSSPSKFS